MGSRLDVKAVFVYYQAVNMTNYHINDVDASVCIFLYVYSSMNPCSKTILCRIQVFDHVKMAKLTVLYNKELKVWRIETTFKLSGKHSPFFNITVRSSNGITL